MRISERIEATIRHWADIWSAPLRGWMGSWLAWGLELILDVIAKKAAPSLRPIIDKLEAETDIPPELKPLLDDMKEPSGEWSAFLAQSAGGALIGGALNRVIDYILRPVTLGLSKAPLFDIPEPTFLMALWLRRKVTDEQLKSLCNWLGVSDEHVEQFKELTKFIPSAEQQVNWLAKEVFEEDMIKFYGLDEEMPKYEDTLFSMVGVTPEQMANFWRAHWIHPALGTVYNLLHRGLITPEQVYRWYRVVEIPPVWRDMLTKASWDLPNRIELRMMARYGLVNKAFLVDQLEKVGLAEEYRSIAADMMLAMGIRTDIATRYGKGWLDTEGVKSELAASGLDSEVADRMYQWIVTNTGGDRIAKERELTKADIYRAVKKAVLTRTEGAELLQGLGYDEKETKLLLDLNAPEEQEVKAVTERQLTKTDILKAFKVGEIDESETLSRLVGIRYTPVDAQLIINITRATTKEIPELKQRELTKVDIIAGVKAGVIDIGDAYIMLQDIGYSAADSQFILVTKIEAEVGSPDTYGEFRRLVERYKAAQGRESREIPLELIQAERDVKATEAALADGKARGVKQERLLQLAEAVETARIAYHQLLQRFRETS